MATAPLVGFTTDLGPLVHVALTHHGVPVADVFDLYEEDTRQSLIGIATPLRDEKGPTAAYLRIFEALAKETFAPQGFLRLNLFVLSNQDLVAIRKALKGGLGEAVLPKLAHLGEVVVRVTADPRTLQLSGMLHISRQDERNYLVLFNSFEGRSLSKPLHLQSEREVVKLCSALSLWPIPDMSGPTKSILVSASLDTIYQQGLI